jgi:hypothetical protein
MQRLLSERKGRHQLDAADKNGLVFSQFFEGMNRGHPGRSGTAGRKDQKYCK